LSLMKSYPWPGNIRELRTVIEHGVVMCNGGEILPSHLPDFLKNTSMAEITSGISAFQSNETVKPIHGWNLSALEKEAISGALHEAEGNRTMAASLLGISRRTLQRKILELSL
jgi:two-component system, NtrC family, response regulator AtoC